MLLEQKISHEEFVPCAFAGTETMHLHIIQFHVIQKFQDPECFHGAREQ